jgi:hypothetical protein
MGIFSAVFGILGLGASIAGSRKAAKAEKRASRIRREMNNLEYRRKQRELIRESILAQAEIEYNASVLGVSAKDSSIKSGIGQNRKQFGQNSVALTQDFMLADRMFKVNSQFNKGQNLQQIGNAIGSVGGAVDNLISSVG